MYTPEQQATLEELDIQIQQLENEADEKYGQYRKLLKGGERASAHSALEQVMAMDEEVRLKKLIGYVPSSGEGKVAKVKEMLAKLGRNGGKKGKPASVKREILEGRLKTLEFVNGFRQEMGLPPLDRLPVGVMGDAAECTIAKAIVMGSPYSPSVRGIGSISVSIGTADFTPNWEVTRQDVEERLTELGLKDEYDAWLKFRGNAYVYVDRTYGEAATDDFLLIRVVDEFLGQHGEVSMASWKYWFVDSVIGNFDNGEFVDLARRNGGSYLDVTETILREHPDALDKFRHDRGFAANWKLDSASRMKDFIEWAEWALVA